MTSTRPTAAQRTAAAREARTRRAMRAVAIPGMTGVATVALWNSYFHIVQLCIEHGQSSSGAHLTPIAIDGLMLVASVNMIASRHAWLPRLCFGAGALLTLGANAASVHHHDVWGYILAATPAIALIGTAEMLLRLCLPPASKRRKTTRKAPQTATKTATSPTRTRARQTAPVTATA